MNTRGHSRTASLCCPEGGTSTKQKEKKLESSEEIILACY